MNSKLEIPPAPDLRVCKNTREMIIQQTEYQRSCFSTIVQELNDGRVINKRQDIEIKNNTRFRHRASGALLILSIIISCGLSLLSEKVRRAIGLP